MKNTLFLLLFGSLLAAGISSPARAAQQFPTFEEAQAKVKEEGYIVFLYPDGWDKYGEKLCKKLIADEGVREAAGEAALILAPVYQKRTEATDAESKRIMGKLGYPGDMGDISYPALAFYNKDGGMYCTLHGEELMNASVAEVAQLLKKRLDAKKLQQELLDKSGATHDVPEKAKYILQAARVDGVSWPGYLKDSLKAADPDDSNGCLAALNFGGISANEGESFEDFEKRLVAVLDNPLLSNWQKQRACAAAIGHIRRSFGTMAGGELITKYAKIMQKLDPESALGISAPVVMRDWVKTYRYGQGWSDQIIPSAPIPMAMHDVPMKKPGTYNVTFKLKTGRDYIRINRLRLLDGNRCIISEDEPREVTWSNTQQTYTFTVKKNLKNPVLEITYGNAPDKRSTWGDITVEAQ